MNLQTLNYLPETAVEQADPTIGLLDLRKGLFTMVKGYVLCIIATMAAAGVAIYVILDLKEGGISNKSLESASTILFAVVLIYYLLLIFSVYLIVRGKWMCLLSAPEQCHAKWMMFMAILLILTGPALNQGAGFLMRDSGEAKARPNRQGKSTADFVKTIEDMKEVTLELDTRGYVRLAGNVASLLSSFFFVMFLRALAQCWNNPIQRAFAELFLFFFCLLLAGVGFALWKPGYMMARPHLLLALGGGWLLSCLWYFGLILGGICCISNVLERKRYGMAG